MELNSAQKRALTCFFKKKATFEAEHKLLTFPYIDMREFSYFYDLSCNEIDLLVSYLQSFKKNLTRKKEELTKDKTLVPEKSVICPIPPKLTVYEKISDILDSPSNNFLTAEILSLEIVEKLSEIRDILQPTPSSSFEIKQNKSAHELYQTKKPRQWKLLKYKFEQKETFRRQVGWLYPDACPRILNEIYSMIDISAFNPSEREFEAIKTKSVYLDSPTEKRTKKNKRTRSRSPKFPNKDDSDSDSDIEASMKKQIALESRPPESDSDSDEPNVENIRKQIKEYVGVRISEERVDGKVRKDILSDIARSCRATRRFPKIQHFANSHPNQLKQILKNLYSGCAKADKDYLR
jgi:hypothetical protein